MLSDKLGHHTCVMKAMLIMAQLKQELILFPPRHSGTLFSGTFEALFFMPHN